MLGAAIHHNKSYFESGAGNDDGSTGIDKSKCINLRGTDNAQKTYLVQEDMTDVFIYVSYAKNYDFVMEPMFDTLSGSSVSCTRIFEDAESSSSLTRHLYYVPKLEKGTTITNFTTSYGSYTYATYLFKADGSHKGQTVYKKNLSGMDAYSVKSDLKDVFYINLYNGNSPTFEVLPGEPIVAYKRLFYSEINGGSVFYIPELKAGTVIRNISRKAHIVY